MHNNMHSTLLLNARKWCPGRDLNPHSACAKKDFKSFASADFATRAEECALLLHKPIIMNLCVNPAKIALKSRFPAAQTRRIPHWGPFRALTLKKSPKKRTLKEICSLHRVYTPVSSS
jgi:hypothetical protein